MRTLKMCCCGSTFVNDTKLNIHQIKCNNYLQNLKETERIKEEHILSLKREYLNKLIMINVLQNTVK